MQLESKVEYMKERYRKIHNIKYEKGQDIGIATYIRVYRNEGKLRCGTPFFNVEFRVIACLYHFFCQLPAVLECGQDIG